MSLREEQCNKVCRILDDVLANRPTERDALIVATRSAFSALSEPHWIPCNKRLPEEDVDVLCQTISGAKLVASYGLLSPWGKEKGWITSEFNRLPKEMIEAWMPLPEPYKGVTE